MPKRRGRPSAAQTPAPKKDVIYGSKKNPKGSAASEKSASKIKLSEKTIESLEKKLKDFKKKHPSKKNVNLGDLKAVYRRGSGAYSKTHRPTITGGAPNTRAAWSFARVNKFLKKAAGESVKKAYVQDDDLLKYEDGGLIWYHKYNDAIGYRVNSHNKYGDGIYFSNQKDSRFEGENELECKINYKNPIIFEGKGLPNLEFHKAKGKKTINQFADELFEKYDAIIIKHGGKFGDEIIIRDENLIEPIKYAKGGKTFNDKELLAKWKRGESIGFTGIAHLKAKGLIPRADGIKRKSEKYMEHGGQTGQEIICVNCGWSWNTNDSDESDKYICHKCGFDNTLYYPSMIALPDTYASENRLKEVLETQGYILNKKNMENKDLLEEGGVVVGKRHSEMDENGETGERFIVESTGQLVEVEGGEGVLCKESMNSDKKYVFEGRKMTGKEIASFLNHKYGGVEFAKGGEVKYVCGCKSKYYHGGELPSSTLDSLKGGEAVVTVKTMESEDKYKFGNKTMTPRQILSKINAEHGGKKFDEGGTIDLSNMDYEVDKNMCKMVFFTEKILYL